MPYTRPYTGGFVDYPSTTTPINSTALNTMDVGIKTANDQFQTVTTAQRAALSPTVGQCVWDSDLKQLMVYMNASGGNAWQPVGNRIVCASTTRPSSPFEGQEIYETDTNKTYVYTGSSWFETADLDNTGGLSDAAYAAIPRGIVARVNITNSQNTSSASPVDVTNATITWTADAARLYKISFSTYMTKATNAGNAVLLITDSSNVQKQNRDTYFSSVSSFQHGFIYVVETGLSGSVTRKIRFATSTASLTVEGGASYPSQLIVEDCGLA